MLAISNANRSDELTTLLRIFMDAPPDGLTIDDIMILAAWSNAMVQQRILDLGGRIRSERKSVKKVRATYYSLKVR